jgi:hypothetical protein
LSTVTQTEEPKRGPRGRFTTESAKVAARLSAAVRSGRARYHRELKLVQKQLKAEELTGILKVLGLWVTTPVGSILTAYILVKVLGYLHFWQRGNWRELKPDEQAVIEDLLLALLTGEVIGSALGGAETLLGGLGGMAAAVK